MFSYNGNLLIIPEQGTEVVLMSLFLDLSLSLCIDISSIFLLTP
jgi:hypothetical protein